ncbi:beta-ketoacyl synthase N-terminal-like domain-containing protein [Anaerosporobacter sp.]
MKKIIAISNMGCICNIGKSVDEFCYNANQLIDEKMKQEIEKIRTVNSDYQDTKIETAMPRLDKCCKLLLTAVDEALRGVEIENLRKKRIGILIGSSYGVANAQGNYLHTLNRINRGLPTYFQATTQNLLSGIIAYRYGLKGLNLTIIDGWTSGLDAVMLGESYIQNGEVDMVIAGGVDCTCSSVQSYHQELIQTGILSKNFCQGEGCGVVVLEGIKEDNQKNYKGILKVVKQGSFYGEDDFEQELQKNEYLYKNIQYYYSNENNTIYDKYEKHFIEKNNLVDSIAIKRYIGECGAASGILQMIHTLKEHTGYSLIFSASCQGKYTYCLIEGK